MRRSFINQISVDDEVTVLKEVARYFGVSPSTVTKWKQEGCPELQNRPYNLFDIAVWLKKNGKNLTLLNLESSSEVYENKLREIDEKLKQLDQKTLELELLKSLKEESSTSQYYNKINLSINTIIMLLTAVGVGKTFSQEIEDGLKRLFVDQTLVDSDGRNIILDRANDLLPSRLSGLTAKEPETKTKVIHKKNTPTPTFTTKAISTPTATATPTPVNYGMIHFHGTVITDKNWQYIPNAKVTISGETIEDHSIYTDSRGQYTATLYGYYYDFYTITVEMDRYHTYRTLSAFDPNTPQDQLNVVFLCG